MLQARLIAKWTFITNHARVLLVIARDPSMRLRDIAATLGITERATQRIVSELVDGGYLSRQRVGRRNSYTVHPKQPLRIQQAQKASVGGLLDLLLANLDPIAP